MGVQLGGCGWGAPLDQLAGAAPPTSRGCSVHVTALQLPHRCPKSLSRSGQAFRDLLQRIDALLNRLRQGRKRGQWRPCGWVGGAFSQRQARTPHRRAARCSDPSRQQGSSTQERRLTSNTGASWASNDACALLKTSCGNRACNGVQAHVKVLPTCADTQHNRQPRQQHHIAAASRESAIPLPL